MLKKHFLELVEKLEFDVDAGRKATALGINPSLLSAYKKDENGEAKAYYVAAVKTLLAIPKAKRIELLVARLEHLSLHSETIKSLRKTRQSVRDNKGEEAEYVRVSNIAKKIGRHPADYEKMKKYFGLGVNAAADVMAWNRGAAAINEKKGIYPQYISFHIESLYSVEPVKLLDIFELAGVKKLSSKSKFYKLVKDSDVQQRFQVVDD